METWSVWNNYFHLKCWYNIHLMEYSRKQFKRLSLEPDFICGSYEDLYSLNCGCLKLWVFLTKIDCTTERGFSSCRSKESYVAY